MGPDDAIILLLLIELCPALSCVPTTVRRRKLIERFGRALIKTSAPRPAAKWNWDESVLPSIAIRLINDATVEMAGWPADVVRILAEATDSGYL